MVAPITGRREPPIDSPNRVVVESLRRSGRNPDDDGRKTVTFTARSRNMKSGKFLKDYELQVCRLARLASRVFVGIPEPHVATERGRAF